jgi:hypothetical protein
MALPAGIGGIVFYGTAIIFPGKIIYLTHAVSEATRLRLMKGSGIDEQTGYISLTHRNALATPRQKAIRLT